jgi:hypothetical protein
MLCIIHIVRAGFCDLLPEARERQSSRQREIMEFDNAVTKWINSFAGQMVTLDFLIVLVANWGIFLLIAMIALRWWSTHEREIARFGAVRCGMAVALGLF